MAMLNNRNSPMIRPMIYPFFPGDFGPHKIKGRSAVSGKN